MLLIPALFYIFPSCWMSTEEGTIFAFVVPVLVIILVISINTNLALPIPRCRDMHNE